MGGRYRWLVMVGVLAAMQWLAAPAEAQWIVSTEGQQRQFDRIRLSAMYWQGGIEGQLDLGDIEGLPVILDVRDMLGLTESEGGYVVEANFGASRRNRFIFTYVDRDHSGFNVMDIDVTIGGRPIQAQVPIATQISLRQARFSYNILLVARPEVEIGFLGGVGWFETIAAVQTSLGDATATLATPYPSFGGNLLINPAGRVRLYAEIVGFPEVSVEQFGGWLADFQVRAEFFVLDNLGINAGYRWYQMDFRLEEGDPAFDLKWTGFLIGAQARF
jgi:hypothetical protein